MNTNFELEKNMRDNKYVITINDQNDFDLYVNGILTITSSLVGGLLVAIAARERVSLHLKSSSESYALAVLREEGVSIEIPAW